MQDTMMDMCIDCRNKEVNKTITQMQQMCPELFEFPEEESENN